MFRTVSLLTASAALATSASAAELVNFDFRNGGDIDETVPFSGGDTAVAGDVDLTSGLVIGSGIDALNRFNSFNGNGLIDGGSQSGSLAEAIADGEFVSFTAGASDGNALDLSGGSLQLNQLTALGNTAAVAFDTVNLFTSVDGFDEEDLLTSVSTSGGTSDVTLGIPDAARFAALTGDVEFRVLFTRSPGNPATSGGGGFRFDQSNGAGVILNGEVVAGEVIPEPASLALLGAGALAFVRRRRA